MTKMAVMSTYGKNLKNLLLWNWSTDFNEIRDSNFLDLTNDDHQNSPEVCLVEDQRADIHLLVWLHFEH